jgi:hypothetical protein
MHLTHRLSKHKTQRVPEGIMVTLMPIKSSDKIMHLLFYYPHDASLSAFLANEARAGWFRGSDIPVAIRFLGHEEWDETLEMWVFRDLATPTVDGNMFLRDGVIYGKIVLNS